MLGIFLKCVKTNTNTGIVNSLSSELLESTGTLHTRTGQPLTGNKFTGNYKGTDYNPRMPLSYLVQLLVVKTPTLPSTSRIVINKTQSTEIRVTHS